MRPFRLLIVSADPLTRAGLVALLADEPSCHIVGQTDAAGLASYLDEATVELVLWDFGWDALSPPQPVLSDVVEQYPLVALITDDADIATFWRGGAQILLRRNSPLEMIVIALRAAKLGLIILDPQFADAISQTAPSLDVSLIDPLTPREQEVLQLLSEGLSNKEIAQRLSISDHTVKFHVNAILSKVEAQSRTEAVVRATRMGLIAL